MAYGQKNYNEIQGINGKYRINQIGCFVTAFCNLLDRFGKGVGDPIALNRILRDNGIYVDVDDGVRDDLAYGSVSRVNGNIVVTGTGLGTPPNNNCIVKFTGLSNGFGTHFCLVQDDIAGTIVDSWDGQIKSWNVYGGPKAWASYEDRSPAAAPAPTPAPQAPADSIVVQAGWGISHVAKAAGYPDWADENRWNYLARINGHGDRSTFLLSPNQVVKIRGIDPAIVAPAPQPAPQSAPAPETVDVTVQPGWGITHVLKAAGYAKEQYENSVEWDRVATLNGSAERLRLKPNQVVKVNRTPLAVAQPQPAPAPTPVPTPVVEVAQSVAPITEAPKPAPVENEDGSVNVTVSIVPKDPKAYQKTLVPEEKVYIASTSKLVYDMDALHMDLQLVSGQKVTSGGRFFKDNEKDVKEEFIISKKHLSLGQWYGIPVDYLGAGKDPNAYVGPLVDDDDDDIFDMDLTLELKEALGNLSGREKFINFLGKIYDVILKLNVFKKKNKTT